MATKFGPKLGKTIMLAGKFFNSKASCLRYLRGKLKYHANGHPIRDKNTHLLLLELLRHHPKVKRKIGKGVDFFFVDRDPEYRKNNCFWVHRVDGKSTPFSMVKALNNYTYKRHDRPMELAKKEVEKWVWLPGYESFYAISNFGRVYSMRKERCMSINTYMKSSGTVTVSLGGSKRVVDVTKECSKVFGYPPLKDRVSTMTDVEIESILRAGVALPSYVREPRAMSEN